MSDSPPTIPADITIEAEWLAEPHLQALLEALAEGGEHEALAVGGAVRNTLLGVPVRDVDVATSRAPEDTVRIAEALGHRPVPTGIAHGTVTVVTPGGAYEVTTFRADVETDGRHAVVEFTNEMRADAERRDFTINALYARADGTVVDVVGGLADIERRAVRFIGDADARITEDFLRILRFFRFHAHYGRGRPDAEGLKACTRHKAGLAQLSVERVWSELRRLLEAPDPVVTLLWMRQTGVLTAVLPESERWGIDAIHALVATERDLGWSVDPLLRLQAIVPPDAARMASLADRLKLSNEERERLLAWAMAAPPPPDLSEAALRKRLYREGAPGILARLRLALASARGAAAENDDALVRAGALSRLLDEALGWKAPAMPVRGRDLIERGMAPGPAVGEAVKRLEDAWIESDFKLERADLLASLDGGPPS